MHRTYIALIFAIFVVSLIGCTTPSSMYNVPKEEIQKPKKAPETIVFFPKDFPEAKKSYTTSMDTETYLRYAKAMDKINVKMKERANQRAKEAEFDRQRRQIEWEKELERRKAEEDRNERCNDRYWYFGRYPYFWRYYPSVRYGLLSKSYYGQYYTWYGLPLTGQRLIIWSATHKKVLGSTNQPTDRGTTYSPGKLVYPSR